MASYSLSTNFQASGIKANYTHFSYFTISKNHTLYLIQNRPPFLLGFFSQSSKQAPRPSYGMVDFLLFPFRQSYRLLGIKFKWPDQRKKYHSHPCNKSYCCIRGDLFRTQILHNSIDNIFYMIKSRYLLFCSFLKLPQIHKGTQFLGVKRETNSTTE